jgi:hypothetical protein
MKSPCPVERKIWYPIARVIYEDEVLDFIPMM